MDEVKLRKGFLLTDATGNVVYIRLGRLASEISHMICDKENRDSIVFCQNTLRTAQRHLIGEYVKAEDDDAVKAFLDGWNASQGRE